MRSWTLVALAQLLDYVVHMAAAAEADPPSVNAPAAVPVRLTFAEFEATEQIPDRLDAAGRDARVYSLAERTRYRDSS